MAHGLLVERVGAGPGQPGYRTLLRQVAQTE